ncbi:MAG: DUF4157 domain-containing protein [Gemmataceae bacterium]
MGKVKTLSRLHQKSKSPHSQQFSSGQNSRPAIVSRSVAPGLQANTRTPWRGPSSNLVQRQVNGSSPAPQIPAPQTETASQEQKNERMEQVAAIVVPQGGTVGSGHVELVGPGEAYAPPQGMELKGFIHQDGSAVKFSGRAGGVHIGEERAKVEFAPLMPQAEALLKGQPTETPTDSVGEEPVQTKMKVDQPDSPLERDADRAAERVMRMPDSLIQREAAEENQEEEVQRMPTEEEEDVQRMPAEEEEEVQRVRAEEKEEIQSMDAEEEEVQRKDNSGNVPTVSSKLASDIRSQKGGGQPLSSSDRGFFEPRFGRDLSNVRVHSDSFASDSAKQLGARAYTVGDDVFFGNGQKSSGGRSLMAHELAHTIQQKPESVSRFPYTAGSTSESPAGTKANAQPEAQAVIYRQTTGGQQPAAAPPPSGATPPGRSGSVPQGKGADGKVQPSFKVDLMGKSALPEDIIAKLKKADLRSAVVDISFGTVAKKGAMELRRGRGKKYYIKGGEAALDLAHPLFAKAAAAGVAPQLIVQMDGKYGIKGYLGWPTLKPGALRAKLKKQADLLGLVGFELPKLPGITNEITNGVLTLGISTRFKLFNAFEGDLTLDLKNENVTFTAEADVKVKGLQEAKLKLDRNEEGLVTGQVTAGVELSDQISGGVDILWNGESIIGMGVVGYKGEKLSGAVTLYLMTKAEAEKKEQERTAPEKEAAAKKKPKRGDDDYVLFGDGLLNFSFTDWLTGSAQVIIDHKGHLTVIGKIEPQAEVTLLDQRDYVQPLAKPEIRARYGIPHLASVGVFVGFELDAFAKLGPAKLYKIAVEGTYSTDPEKANDFRIRGSLNISAAAGLRLRAEGGAVLEILLHDIKAGVGVTGTAGVQGYAEATPVIGYREKKGDEATDKKGEFFISGDLEIVGQPFLALSGDLFIEVDAPWASPVPDKTWTWPLGGKTWPLSDPIGLVVSMDYVLGSGEWPEFEFKAAEFDANKFTTDLLEDRARPGAAKKEEKPGKWKEKNSENAAPPAPKPSTKQQGQPADKPAKSKVTPSAIPPGEKSVDSKGRPAKDTTAKDKKSAGAKKNERKKKEPKTSHDKQLEEGLKALDAVTNRYGKEGATRKELQTAVKAVRRKFSVFKSIQIVEKGEYWSYHYVASDGHQTGPRRATKDSTGSNDDGGGAPGGLSAGTVRARIGQPTLTNEQLGRAVDLLNKRSTRAAIRELERLGVDVNNVEVRRLLAQHSRYANLRGERPRHSSAQVREVWRRAQDANGRVFDRTTNPPTELFWRPGNRHGQWQMGHREGHSYQQLHQQFMSGQISYQEFLNEVRNPANYFPQAPRPNMGRHLERGIN